MIYSVLPTPIGRLLLIADGPVLIGLDTEPFEDPEAKGWLRDDAALRPIAAQLSAYFAGDVRRFDLPMELRGTAFQRLVWEAVMAVPYGETISYGELARRIGTPSAARAVGTALGQNPIAVIVPCHRIVSSGGRPSGSGGGLDRRRWLLELEGADSVAPSRPGPRRTLPPDTPKTGGRRRR